MTEDPAIPEARGTRFFRVASAIVFGVLVLAAIGGSIFAFVVQQQRIDALNGTVAEKNVLLADQDAQIISLLEQYAELAGDCEEAQDCETTTPDPEDIADDLPAIQGDQGPQGPPPSDAQVYDQIRAYCAVRDECRGPTGTDGLNGTNGTNGTNGADSTVPGPQGDPGPAGAPGASGEPPYSWTYVDALGFTYTCTRTEPFEAFAPTYTCSP